MVRLSGTAGTGIRWQYGLVQKRKPICSPQVTIWADHVQAGSFPHCPEEGGGPAVRTRKCLFYDSQSTWLLRQCSTLPWHGPVSRASLTGTARGWDWWHPLKRRTQLAALPVEVTVWARWLASAQGSLLPGISRSCTSWGVKEPCLPGSRSMHPLEHD